MAAPDPGELVQFPSGEAIFYLDDDHPTESLRHSYWRANRKTVKGVVGWHRGTRLTGVTSVTKTLDYDPGKLLRWAARTQLIGVAELVGPVLLGEGEVDNLHWLADHESIWRELERNQLTFDDVRDRAARKGTNVHRAALQALAMGRPVPDFDAISDDERGYANAVVAFWLDHEPRARNVEQIVYSPSLGVAGRLDFYGAINLCGDDGCGCHSTGLGSGVLDLKTGKYISAAAHAQVGGGYPALLEESGYGESHWALILKVSDDGTYELTPAQGTREGFTTAVATYREAGRINREAAKDYKARKAAREAVAA